MAVVPYTTLCSPNRMSLPGAEQRTVVMPWMFSSVAVVVPSNAIDARPTETSGPMQVFCPHASGSSRVGDKVSEEKYYSHQNMVSKKSLPIVGPYENTHYTHIPIWCFILPTIDMPLSSITITITMIMFDSGKDKGSNR